MPKSKYDTLTTIRTNIPLIVAQKRLTLAEICRGAGITYETMRMFLNGSRDMTISKIDRVAIAMGYTSIVGLIRWSDG